MKIDEFWRLVEESDRQTQDRTARTAWLEARLCRLRPAEIADFQVFLDRARTRVDTYDMWAAASQIFGDVCSGDSFWYFLAWLVGRGRDAFERAADNPDNLAELPEVVRLAARSPRDWSEDDEWPCWEELGYIARWAFDQVTGKEEGIYDTLNFRGHRSPSDPEFVGRRWDYDDPAERRQRIPRLYELFGSRAAEN